MICTEAITGPTVISREMVEHGCQLGLRLGGKKINMAPSHRSFHRLENRFEYIPEDINHHGTMPIDL
jgi:hypothetical protein